MKVLQTLAGKTLAILVAAAAVGLVLLSIPGCSVLTPPGSIPVSQSLSPAAQQAQSLINEANVLLTAAANVIAQNVVDGIYTKDEGQAQLNKVKALAAQVDKAAALLMAGEVLSAKDQAELTRKLIIALHREVAERKRS